MYQKAIEFSFQALGSQVSNVVVNYLARKYGISLADTFSKPESLGEALESTLGAGGDSHRAQNREIDLSSALDSSEQCRHTAEQQGGL